MVNLSMRNYLRPTNIYMPAILEFLAERRRYYLPDSQPIEPYRMGVLPFSIEFENRYRAACLESDTAEATYLAANSTHESRMQTLINMPRDLLGWITVYVANERETSNHFLPRGILAPAAGGYINAEFER